MTGLNVITGMLTLNQAIKIGSVTTAACQLARVMGRRALSEENRKRLDGEHTSRIGRAIGLGSTLTTVMIASKIHLLFGSLCAGTGILLLALDLNDPDSIGERLFGLPTMGTLAIGASKMITDFTALVVAVRQTARFITPPARWVAIGLPFSVVFYGACSDIVSPNKITRGQLKA